MNSNRLDSPRKRFRTLGWLALLSALLAVPVSADEVEDWAKSIVRARSLHKALPAHSHQSRMATEGMAYDVQKLVVKEQSKGARVIGHKAGLTSAATQGRFGLLEPAAGVLLSTHQLNSGAYVGLRRYPGMVIEMELGFVFKITMRERPETVDEVKAAVREIVPVVELPDVYFEPRDKLSGLDIIASNVAATKVIIGRGKPAVGRDPNAIATQLFRGTALVTEGVGSDAMGDQWQALLWLVQQRIDTGYEIKRNDLLITGALGEVIPAEAGAYKVEFGDLGTLRFSMR